MTELDAETRAAIDALVFRLKNRGDSDDEPFAAEFIAALRGRGWRPTEARAAPDWRRAPGDARVPDAGRPGSAEYLAAKAALAARVTGPQQRLTEGNDNQQEAAR